MYAIVPDTNVLVSGSIVLHGNPAFILDSWRNEKVQIIISLEILDEFQRVMLEKFNAPQSEVEILNAFFIWKGKVVEPKKKFNIIKEDPTDNKFLEVAVEGNADYIVFGDKDLRRLKNFMGIEIISPAEMASILRNCLRTQIYLSKGVQIVAKLAIVVVYARKCRFTCSKCQF